jgi:hypothetical protein
LIDTVKKAEAAHDQDTEKASAVSAPSLFDDDEFDEERQI